VQKQQVCTLEAYLCSFTFNGEHFHLCDSQATVSHAEESLWTVLDVSRTGTVAVIMVDINVVTSNDVC